MVAQGAAPQLTGQIGKAGAPSVLIRQFLQHLVHGHTLAYDVRFDFVSCIHKCILLLLLSYRHPVLPMQAGCSAKYGLAADTHLIENASDNPVQGNVF